MNKKVHKVTRIYTYGGFYGSSNYMHPLIDKFMHLAEITSYFDCVLGFRIVHALC
jgi:hypothetical protein